MAVGGLKDMNWAGPVWSYGQTLGLGSCPEEGRPGRVGSGEGDLAWKSRLCSALTCDLAAALTQGQLCPPGDIWQCLDTSLVVTSGEEGASGI